MLNRRDNAHTPRARIRDALAHRRPAHVPFSWGFGPTPEMSATLCAWLAARGLDWSRLRQETDDTITVTPAYTGPSLPPHTDIWGIVRAAQSYGSGEYDEMRVYPLAGTDDPAALDDYPWPDPAAFDDAGCAAGIRGRDPGHRRARKLAIAACGNPFEIYCWMTGLEEAMTHLVLRPALVHAALERITGYFEARLRRALAALGPEIDILYYADDLGGQRGLLMSRRTYRAILQPYHRRLFALGKARAPQAAVMMHSDGSVFDILPDVIDAGLEVFEAVQVDAAGMAPERLKAAYGDRLAFHGGIAVQSLLPHADAETVEAECRRLVAVFGRDGGYIAAPTHAIQAGTPPENVLAMLRAVLGDGGYEAAREAARL
jgi:uroporphyrinogen decarboxylase